GITSIIIGIILLAFGIYQFFIGHKKLLGLISAFHSLLFLCIGIFGLVVPKKYDLVITLLMLAFTITMIISLMVLFKKENKK
ncbi:MAG: hypothetical protein K6E20_07300, partial [Acholeplasmatales bacterium]|nr:hypothetical protein [Acholeplasmatales bacterium]